MSASELPPHAQKVVVGKWLGLQVLAPWLSSLDQRVARRLEAHLCWLTDAVLDDPDALDDLHAFLALLDTEMSAEIRRWPKRSQDMVVHIVRDFTALVTGFCKSPYDPLMRLVNAVARTSSDWYVAYHADVPQEVWRDAQAKSSFLRGEAGLSFAPHIHLNIQTVFNNGKGNSARILLRLAPIYFDIMTMAALPRALLHEYIAHVPQGPYSMQRVNPDANDAFAEGWMDYVAHRVHRAVLERQGPSDALAEELIPTWAALYENAAESFFSGRNMHYDGDAPSAARCEGAAAARLLHELLRRLPETENDADAYLFRLSCGLNVSQFDSVTRQTFVAVVRRSLSLASQADQVTQPLRKWAKGEISLDHLIGTVLAIRSSTDV